MTRPLVSIITPSYNQARYLEATLRSVAVQDYPWIEHIVLDGGSTDGSVDIIRRWAAKHPTIWRSGPDGGQAAAIQQGVAMATGDIVAWLNSDDVYLDERVVSDVVAHFEEDVGIVTGGGWYLSEDGARLRQIPVERQRISHEVLRCVDWILQPATFVRRDLLLRHPIDTSLTFAFDWDLFVRLTREATAVPIERDLAGYRVHQSGKTVSGGSRRRQELLTVTRRYNGRYAPRSLLLGVVTLLHHVADALPGRTGRIPHRLLDDFARLTQRLANGWGIQW